MVNLKQNVQKIFDLADVKINGSRPWDIQVHNPKFYGRVLAGGSLALGESYMDGWWDSKKLDQFFYRLLRAKIREKIKPSKQEMTNIIKAKILNLQSKRRSNIVAEKHYDLGNDMYELMLDKRMAYTCAYWKNAKTLNKAQEDKLELVCKKINLKKEDHVLDLGCGWGSFAKYAAEKYGCQVTAVNISKEQVKYAREQCRNLPVNIIQSDYRAMKGKYDKIVSIGLCEHIGLKNYKTFMKLTHKCLKKDGLMLMHTIGANISINTSEPWIMKYIFPNSKLPSIRQISEAAEKLFIIEDLHNFGPDYDKTLMAWDKNFTKNWDKIKKEYDNRFYRMWRYYLLGCAGSFRARHVQLWQIVFSKNGVLGGYNSIR